MKRKLSFKALLALAVFCLFGYNAMAQPGVTINPVPGNPPAPRATLDVLGDLRVKTIPIGGFHILTWDSLPTPDGDFQHQVRRINVPANTQNGQTLVWNSTTNKWEVGNAIGKIKVDTSIFELRGDSVLYLKTLTRNEAGSIIVWDGTQWVFRRGGGGRNYVGKFPIVVTDTVISFAETDKDGNPLPDGTVWEWDTTTKSWIPGTGGGGAGWLVGGNTNITTVNDFFGTRNAQPIYVRTNNVERMRVLANGQIVAGGTAPNARDLFSVFSTGQNFSVVGYGNGVTGTTYPTEGGGVAGVGSVFGVYGSAETTNQITYGVMGETYSTTTNAAGLYGGANGSTGSVYGVWGQTSSREGATAGVLGVSTETTTTAATFGVRGQTFSNQSGSAGVQGIGITGASYGVMGANESSTSFAGGVLGTSTGQGNTGSTYYGVFGLSRKSCDAIGIGVYGEGTTYGIVGRTTGGCQPQGNNALSYAIFSQGNIGASGVKQFHIDHPADPSNKYLNHAAIESNEALNLYSGNITTDANGEATVELPVYVQQINKDFRYTLTCMGQLANAAVLKKLENNRFVIKTDKPNVEVSWLLTCQRNDPYMQKYPFKAEVEKPTAEKGKYLHPELYNQPENKGIFHNPEVETTLKNVDTKAVTPRVSTRQQIKR